MHPIIKSGKNITDAVGFISTFIMCSRHLWEPCIINCYHANVVIQTSHPQTQAHIRTHTHTCTNNRTNTFLLWFSQRFISRVQKSDLDVENPPWMRGAVFWKAKAQQEKMWLGTASLSRSPPKASSQRGAAFQRWGGCSWVFWCNLWGKHEAETRRWVRWFIVEVWEVLRRHDVDTGEVYFAERGVY